MEIIQPYSISDGVNFCAKWNSNHWDFCSKSGKQSSRGLISIWVAFFAPLFIVLKNFIVIDLIQRFCEFRVAESSKKNSYVYIGFVSFSTTVSIPGLYWRKPVNNMETYECTFSSRTSRKSPENDDQIEIFDQFTKCYTQLAKKIF